MELSNTVKIAQKLVQIESVTPNDNGCQEYVKELLKPYGFQFTTLKSNGVTNLLAFHGTGAPFTLFLGHTDVVPTGDPALWDHPPFSGQIIEENGEYLLFGRGSCDMKGGDAAMIQSMIDYISENKNHKGTIGLLLTSNEEGDAVGATPYVVEYLKDKNLIPDYCIIAECSCDNVFGDSIKNGRRGDLNASIYVHGIQGHVALGELAKNSVFESTRLIQGLLNNPIDKGTDYFPPTSFEVSNIKAGTGADNVIPGDCYIRANFRWNDMQTPESIEQHVRDIAKELNIDCDMEFREEGKPFLTKNGELIDAVSASVSEVLGITPNLGTSGGTSDGRFIRPLGTQTIEFGPVSNLIHKVNERVSIKVLEELTLIFTKTLEKLH